MNERFPLVIYNTNSKMNQCRRIFISLLLSIIPSVLETTEFTSSMTTLRPLISCAQYPFTPTSLCRGLPCQYGDCVDYFDEEFNTFGQTCQCWPGWTDQFCRTCCDMPCDESRGGVCYVYTPDDSMRCRCYNKNYTGTYCNETVFVNDTLSAETESTQIILLDVTPLPSSGLLPQPILPWQLALIALGGVLAILMIITVLLLTYFRRRKSLLWKKLVYKFSSYEDDYTRKYDAFVSYRGHGEDLQFVRYKLMEKLEKEMNFKLCLDYREFVGGKCIAENILHAIQKSRRTILVISPNYAEGEWPRFEYQAAQKEMLGMRHRIIPILFKDVSKVNKLDVNLRYIMDKITYIEWPGEEDEAALSRFWEQLRLSMPKKKQSDVTQVSHA